MYIIMLLHIFAQSKSESMERNRKLIEIVEKKFPEGVSTQPFIETIRSTQQLVAVALEDPGNVNILSCQCH